MRRQIFTWFIIFFCFIFLFIRFFLGAPIASDSLVSQLNQVRKNYGLADLKENPQLYFSAGQKACDLAEKKYWSHTDPSNHPFDWWITKAGYHFHLAGENLARNFKNDTIMITAWMNSPKHRANILSKDYQEIGIGRCGIYTVIHFGQR
jgi:uncharacterized protein YkwD